MRHAVRWVLRGAVMLVTAILVLALLGAVVMLLWNALVPALFRGPVLQYGQAVGLLLLSRLLFGGLRGRGWHGYGRARAWRERWERMTPQERARLAERCAGGCGHGGEGTAAAPKDPM